jgi:GNAT superfamily N-acetyltransferase
VVEVRAARRGDLGAIERILTGWLDGEKDVASRLETVRTAIDGAPSRWCLVAEESSGHIVGVAGLQADGIEPEIGAGAVNPVEAVIVYVERSLVGRGIGRALMTQVEALATEQGFTDLLVVSGSRHRESGYPFWRHRYDEPFLRQPDRWGPGEELVAWRHRLT